MPLPAPVRALDGEQLASVEALLADAPPAESARLAADDAWARVAATGGRSYAAVLLDGPDGLDAYAQLARSGSSWALEVAQRHPGGRAVEVADALRALVAVAADGGGGAVHWWIHRPDAAHRTLAADVGLVEGRELRQLRRRLPVEEAPTIATRAFVPGRDEEAWLRTNNRSFAGHPDQGGWTIATLQERTAEPWFDPAGFLLHVSDPAGPVDGFCWTKVHPPTDAEPEALGEIYVIGIDPDAGGRGLGRQLVLAGLEHLHAGRDVPVGMLYVDGSNESAVRLYDGLGFAVHHVDVAFQVDVAPASSSPSADRRP